MKHKTVVLAIVMSAFSFVNLVAQPGHSGREHSHEQKERIKEMKRTFIKNELQLSASESPTFWKVYDEFELKRQALRKAHREMRKQFKQRDPDSITEAEAQQLLKDELLFKERKLQLAKDYDKALQKVIPAVEILKLHHAERRFKRALLDKIKNRAPKLKGRQSGNSNAFDAED